jgi:hypothetical protein
METLVASAIEPGSAPLEPTAPAVRAILEIGPYDLPEPPGGWIDLVLDDDDEGAASAGGDAAARAEAEARPGPATPPPSAPSEKGPRVTAEAATARKRWFLVPEALVVAGFVLFGAAFLVGVILFRAPRQPPALGDSVSAPVEVTDPSAGHAGRRAGRGAPAAARWGAAPAEAEPATPAASPPPELEPIGADSPIDPESPPAPTLAPWRGPG